MQTPKPSLESWKSLLMESLLSEPCSHTNHPDLYAEFPSLFVVLISFAGARRKSSRLDPKLTETAIKGNFDRLISN